LAESSLSEEESSSHRLETRAEGQQQQEHAGYFERESRRQYDKCEGADVRGAGNHSRISIQSASDPVGSKSYTPHGCGRPLKRLLALDGVQDPGEPLCLPNVKWRAFVHVIYKEIGKH
jgi:hypothetical protein